MPRPKGVQRPLNEEIRDLDQKIKLLQGDRKAYNESSELAINECKKRISELRKENNLLRCQLRDRLSADDHVINQAFQNKPVERAMLANKKTPDAIETMDYKVSDGKKKLNVLRFQNAEKQRRLDELKYQYEEYCKDTQEAQATIEGVNKEGQRLRDLENRLDKAKLKCDEADHIKKTYEQIKSKLEEEHLNYGNNLDEMEYEIKQCRAELSELKRMQHDAQLTRDAALEELHRQEDLVYSERKRREQELKNMKAEAEKKKLQQEKFEKRIAARDSSSNQEEARTAAIIISEEQQRNIATYEDIFRVIKDATGVSDLEEVVLRFENQGDTKTHLEELKKSSERTIAQLREEKERLENSYAEMKYTGETKMSHGQKVLEEYKQQVDEEEERRLNVQNKLERANKVLIQCRSGAEHLHDKLRNVRGGSNSNTTSNSSGGGGGGRAQIDAASDEFVLDLLSRSEEKLLQLLENLSSQDIEAQISKMKEEDNLERFLTFGEFQQKIEDHIPSHNTRIKLPTVQKENVYEDEESGDDEADVQTRDSIKKQSQQIVDLKTKKRDPRKKKKSKK